MKNKGSLNLEKNKSVPLLNTVKIKLERLKTAQTVNSDEEKDKKSE
jgi:hypothetical protein